MGRGGARYATDASREDRGDSNGRGASMDGSGNDGRMTMAQCDRLTSGWAQNHKDAIQKTAAKFGPPTEGTMNCVVWRNVGPFKCIKVEREEVTHKFPVEHVDFLEHTIAYRIPSERVSDVTACDGSLYVDRTGGLLSAKCDTEAHNLLGLNIAHDILSGQKTAQQGREAYQQIVKDEMAGRSHPYLEGLRFQPGSEASRDADMSTSGSAGMDGMDRMRTRDGQGR